MSFAERSIVIQFVFLIVLTVMMLVCLNVFVQTGNLRLHMKSIWRFEDFAESNKLKVLQLNVSTERDRIQDGRNT